jgi:hypothetical protein
MDEDQETRDPALEAMEVIIAAITKASATDETPLTDLKILIGLLETASSLVVLLHMPAKVLMHLMSATMADALERDAQVRSAQQRTATTPDQTGPAVTPHPAHVVVPSSTLTADQVREILARMKDGGCVH